MVIFNSYAKLPEGMSITFYNISADTGWSKGERIRRFWEKFKWHLDDGDDDDDNNKHNKHNHNNNNNNNNRKKSCKDRNSDCSFSKKVVTQPQQQQQQEQTAEILFLGLCHVKRCSCSGAFPTRSQTQSKTVL